MSITNGSTEYYNDEMWTAHDDDCSHFYILAVQTTLRTLLPPATL